MERNSLGQFIVNESGSSTVSIEVTEQYISLDQYNRFLLDNKEFTELTPTIDKDALIKELTTQVNTLNSTVNSLTTDLRGGFLVSVTTPQYAYPVTQPNAFTYNGQKVWESIGFNDDSTPPNFNSRQSNGLKFWSIPNKVATVYSDANSEATYDLNATIKFRFKYIGKTELNNVTAMETRLFFWRDGISTVDDPKNNVLTAILKKQSYKEGEVSEEFEMNPTAAQTLGGNVIYLPVVYRLTRPVLPGSNSTANIPNDFIMEILPESTFSFLPR
jgi:hypothetical protein